MMVQRALVVVAACASAGCSTPPVEASDPPPDFSLSITVFARENLKGDFDVRTLARPLRPGRYILEPDNELRVAIGAGAAPTTYPAAMRRLTAAQRQEVWKLVQRTGFLDTRQSDALDPDRPPPVVSRPTALLSVGAYDTRHAVQVSLDAPGAEPSRALIDRLADLAWVEK